MEGRYAQSINRKLSSSKRNRAPCGWKKRHLLLARDLGSCSLGTGQGHNGHNNMSHAIVSEIGGESAKHSVFDSLSLEIGRVLFLSPHILLFKLYSAETLAFLYSTQQTTLLLEEENGGTSTRTCFIGCCQWESRISRMCL
jgi:hypothetical protein